ncbi:MAG: hypothetical protein ACLFRP_09725 [Puniceicoccaceae bacterium]
MLGAQGMAELADMEKESPLAFLDELESSGAATFGWDSIYLAEGRDDLEDGGLYTAGFAGEAGPLAVGAWYADGTEVDYNEWNLFGELGFALTEELSVYAGFTYLAFFEEGDKSEDREIGAGASYAIGGYLEAAADYVYSFESEGSFVELALAAPLEPAADLELAPYVLLGLDFGYRTEAYDGFNHFQVGVDAAYALTGNFAVGGYAAYAFALEDIDKEEDRTGEDIGDNPAFGLFASLSF